MSDHLTLSSSQVDKCGELLVQYQLLRHGIEAAAITSDPSIDLVAYSGVEKRPFAIQVRTNLRPTPAGLKGMALDWWLPEGGAAELVVLVELQHERIWALTQEELAAVAQRASGGRLHVFVYTDPHALPLSPSTNPSFDRFLLKERIPGLFGAVPVSASVSQTPEFPADKIKMSEVSCFTSSK